MADNKSIEIICPACGKESLLKRIPRYEGFKRVGEDLACTLCGHVFAGESEVTFKQKPASSLFSPADLDAKPDVFDPDDAARLCRHCEYYVVNPFIQRCSLRSKEVEATDSCPKFTKRKEPKKHPEPGSKS